MSSDIEVPADAGQYADGLRRILRRFPDPEYAWIECQRGWYGLIVDLDRQLAGIAPDYVLVQVKEKFGGLRYYAESPQVVDETGSEYRDEDKAGPFEALISEAEARSYRICEQCGNEGAPTEGGWVKTLCESCRDGGAP